MTRFYTEYEIKKQDSKLNENLLSGGELYKEELKDAIDNDNHRNNVDRAKKKAVSQLMDYDNFHQMVLGADLKGMKLSEVTEIKPERGILNTVTEKQKFSEIQNDMFYRNFTVENDKKKFSFKDDDELTLQKFKITWKNFKENKEKINYLNTLFYNKIDLFNKLFDISTIDADLYVEFIYQIGIFIYDLQEKNDICEFLFLCLSSLQKFNYFNKLKMFLSKKHKEIYNKLINEKEWIKNDNNFKDIIFRILSK